MLPQFSIGLEETQRAIAAAFEQAKQNGRAVAVAVVENHGELIAWARMDGAHMRGCCAMRFAELTRQRPSRLLRDRGRRNIDPTNTFECCGPWPAVPIPWSRSKSCAAAGAACSIRASNRKKGFNSRAVIDACWPFEWIKDFPPVAESSPELKEKIYNKWKKVIEG